ncbi:MAG: hypothetical protein EOO38_00710 [Cytophagaceae bacterium]|nr:MAG: hypothetical protein EOO38_00710 [Cytophagaceae bacterium]
MSYRKELPYNRAYDLRIELEDWTVKTFTRAIIATCDGVRTVISLAPQTSSHEPRQEKVDLWNWSAEDPLTFENFYNRLDYLPDNGLGPAVQALPVLALSINEKDEFHPGAAANELRVPYSYAMN